MVEENQKHQESENQAKHADDEIAFDLSKVASFFKKKKHTEQTTEEKAEGKKEHEGYKSAGKDDEISISLSDISSIGKKAWEHRAWLVILIAMLFAILIRVQPMSMPITMEWATNSVDESYRSNIGQQISQQYPNLPAENQRQLADAELAKLKEQNKDVYEQQVKQTSDQFKSHFQDDLGQTYLLGIDEWQWHRYAGDILEHGFMGDKIVDGQYLDAHMLAPHGRIIGQSFHPYFIAYFSRFLSLFGTTNLLTATFLSVVVFASLSVIPAYFLGRKIGGEIAGTFSALIIAIHPVFAARTIAGLSDTDVYTLFFPLLLFYLFVEAFTAATWKKKIILTALTGFTMGVFSFTWEGWWYTFDFILAITGLYLLYYVVKSIAKRKENESIAALLKKEETKRLLALLGLFFVCSMISVMLFTNVSMFGEAFKQPFSIAQLKTAAGDFGVWPNVYTTVAELNEVPLSGIIDNLGGGQVIARFFMLLASLSLPILVFKRSEDGERKRENVLYAIMLFVWFFGTLYASTKGVRFIMLAIPPFALALTTTLAASANFLKRWFEKELHVPAKLTVAVFVIVFLLLFGISPYPPFCTHGMCAGAKAMGYGSVPSYTDAWTLSLGKINATAKDDAIINSWWDFGHWFKAGADRAVTFDGASQNRPQAHWMGKVLLTSNEKEAVGILRMLDCGANDAFDLVQNATNDPVKAVNIVYKAIVEDKKAAALLLKKEIGEEAARKVIEKTHCDPPENYFVTSTDMIGKAGVWAHFGSWDFVRSSIWLKVGRTGMKIGEAKQYMMENFGLNEKEAENMYYDVQSLSSEQDANTWISQWPNYLSSSDCQQQGELLGCPHQINGQQLQIAINLSDMSSVIMNSRDLESLYSVSYMDKNNVFTEKKAAEGRKTMPFSIALINRGDGSITSTTMDYRLAGSTFTRLYYFQDNAGMKHFDFFDQQHSLTGWDIFTWKVNWDGTGDATAEEPRSIPLFTSMAPFLPSPAAPEDTTDSTSTAPV